MSRDDEVFSYGLFKITGGIFELVGLGDRYAVISRFPKKKSTIDVIFGVLTIESTKWRGLTIGLDEIERIYGSSKKLRENPMELEIILEVA